MFKAIEQLSDRLLSKFVPKSTAAASCPCGAYPYTGPCWYTIQGGSQVNYQHKHCLCQNSGGSITCGGWHYG